MEVNDDLLDNNMKSELCLKFNIFVGNKLKIFGKLKPSKLVGKMFE